MRRGDFAAAWEETDRIEQRRRALERAGGLKWRDRYLLWNGQPFPGRRVLIRCNHGLGDTLQFLRFVPKVCAMAHSITLLAQPALLPLLQTSKAFGKIRNGWGETPVPAHDVEIEIMELAYALRTTLETLPAEIPYLPATALASKLPPLLPATDCAESLNIGLLWAASGWDSRRSLPLCLLDDLCAIRGARFYSLQQGEHATEPTALSLHPLASTTREVIQAARAMLELDLILTVDSMAAHLAGALGRPVWMLLRRHADWRWMDTRPDSPWYPTMRIFRQQQEGDWEPVVAAVATALEQFKDSLQPTTADEFLFSKADRSEP